jgi:hypothetical protein
MVAAKEAEPATISRDMRAKRTRRSVITVGTVKIEIVPVGLDGHNGWKVLMPESGRIEHISLTIPTPIK